MHPRLTELTERLAQRRSALLEVASAVPTGSWQTRLADDRWTVAETLEHLHRVERLTAAVLVKRIAKARAEGHPAETDSSSVLGILDRFRVSDRSRTLAAPDIAMPTENPDGETIERRLAESRVALLAAIESGDGLALGAIRHTHLRLGELDLYQWILLVAEHEARHTLQLRELARQLVPVT